MTPPDHDIARAFSPAAIAARADAGAPIIWEGPDGRLMSEAHLPRRVIDAWIAGGSSPWAPTTPITGSHTVAVSPRQLLVAAGETPAEARLALLAHPLASHAGPAGHTPDDHRLMPCTRRLAARVQDPARCRDDGVWETVDFDAVTAPDGSGRGESVICTPEEAAAQTGSRRPSTHTTAGPQSMTIEVGGWVALDKDGYVLGTGTSRAAAAVSADVAVDDDEVELLRASTDFIESLDPSLEAVHFAGEPGPDAIVVTEAEGDRFRRLVERVYEVKDSTEATTAPPGHRPARHGGMSM